MYIKLDVWRALRFLTLVLLSSAQICVAMKQTTLLLFSFTHSRSLNRWVLFWSLIDLDVNDTSPSFNIMKQVMMCPLENASYSATLWLLVFVPGTMSCFSALFWCSSLTTRSDDHLIQKSRFQDWKCLEYVLLKDCHAGKENTCIWWKTPRTPPSG